MSSQIELVIRVLTPMVSFLACILSWMALDVQKRGLACR